MYRHYMSLHYYARIGFSQLAFIGEAVSHLLGNILCVSRCPDMTSNQAYLRPFVLSWYPTIRKRSLLNFGFVNIHSLVDSIECCTRAPGSY